MDEKEGREEFPSETEPIAGFVVRTPEQIAHDNRKLKRKTGLFVRVIRVVRDNPDLVAFGVVVFLVFGAGWFFCRVWFNLTAAQIKAEITEFIGLFVFVAGAVMAAIGKLYVKQGVISSSLSGRASHDHDETGNSIVPR